MDKNESGGDGTVAPGCQHPADLGLCAVPGVSAAGDADSPVGGEHHGADQQRRELLQSDL